MIELWPLSPSFRVRVKNLGVSCLLIRIAWLAEPSSCEQNLVAIDFAEGKVLELHGKWAKHSEGPVGALSQDVVNLGHVNGATVDHEHEERLVDHD